MADSVNNEDLLMRYIDGDLPAGEKAAVEQRLKTDAGFREQYQSLQVAVQAIRHLGTIQSVESVHREMMNELRNEQPVAKVVPLRKYIRYALAVAASVFVLVIGVRLYQNAHLSPDSIYNETFVDFNVANTRSTGNTLSGIETLYQQKAYDQIITSPRAMTLSGKDSLLIGLSYLHKEDYPAAVRWFHSLSATESDYHQDAEFYLGLGYLKTKNYEKALASLQAVHNNPAHLYREQVSDEVLEKLKKLSHR